jgi:hypothetical protein
MGDHSGFELSTEKLWRARRKLQPNFSPRTPKDRRGTRRPFNLSSVRRMRPDADHLSVRESDACPSTLRRRLGFLDIDGWPND